MVHTMDLLVYILSMKTSTTTSMTELSTTNSITLRFLAQPSDVNFGGKVHGGAVMKWIDQAGYTCAAHWSGQYCVTVYVGGIRFYQPIAIGNLVEITASVFFTGKTSMHIAINVFASNPRESARIKTTHCIMVFAAVDDAGKTAPVPTWTPQTA